MLDVLVTDEFSAWWCGQADDVAEEVATAIEVVERLGVAHAAPRSHEWLLWYEHPVRCSGSLPDRFSRHLAPWGAFHGYTKRVLEQLESPRFLRRLERLPAPRAAEVLGAVEKIKQSATPLRFLRPTGLERPGVNPVEEATATVRRWYLEALSAAGLEPVDVSAHSSALRELTIDGAPRVRLLYGVDVPKETALFVLGEPLDRAFYGDSVRFAERTWRAFREGSLRATEASAVR